MSYIDSAYDSLKISSLNAWLIYDYRGSNPVFEQMLGIHHLLTRRAFILVSRDVRPTLLLAKVDYSTNLQRLNGFDIETYSSWRELNVWLDNNLGKLKTVAMEYSSNGELPALSRVDKGTIELIEANGCKVVSSAELLQKSLAVISEESEAALKRASIHLSEIKDGAFSEIERRLKQNEKCDEYGIQQWIEHEFTRRGLIRDGPPIVAVNKNSGNPHYSPSPKLNSPIKKGDFILIDLWAKEDSVEAVFADITWVGFAGKIVPQKYQEVFYPAPIHLAHSNLN